MNRQYIGARYVPKFFNNNGSNDWIGGIPYEALVIVTDMNNSYTSCKPVPSNIGRPSQNPEFWVCSGNYNAQVEEYRQDVEAYKVYFDEAVDEVNETISSPEHFGAKGDGTTDDTIAIQEALNEKGLVVFQKNKTYIVSDNLIVPSGTTIIGNGAKIKVKDNNRIENGIFMIDGVTNVSVNELVIDMNMQNMPVYTENRVTRYNVGAWVNNSYNVSFTNCSFINLYNQAIFLYDTHETINIENCTFETPVQNQNGCAEFVVLQTIAGDTVNVKNNLFKVPVSANADYGVSAVTASGTSCTLNIVYNKIVNCGRNNVGGHRLAPIDLYGDCSNVYVDGNDVISLHMFMRIEDSDNVHVTNNKFVDVSQDRESADEPFVWIDFGGVYVTRDTVENIYVQNNVFECNGNKVGNVIAIWNAKTNSDKVLNNIYIQNNKIKATVASAINCDGRCNNLYIENNDIYSPSTICINVRNGSVTTESVSVKNHHIKGNTLVGVRGIDVVLTGSNITVSGVFLCDNHVTATNEAIETTVQSVVSGNMVNNSIYCNSGDTNYSLCVGNIFDNSVAYPFTGSTYLQSGNSKGNSIIS